MRFAVIPARGGSKRIPDKNIRSFAGKPMIVHSIEKATAAAVFDRILVSTDSPEIAAIAREAGAETPFVRPENLADDHASTGAVMKHAVETLSKTDASIAAFCCIYATAPLMAVADLQAGLQLFESGDWDYVFAATKYGYPIWRSFECNAAGAVRMFFPDKYQVRSQDLPEAWHDAGQFYWGRPRAWTAQTPIFSGVSTFVELPAYRVQDIDTLDDWQRAEIIFEALRARDRSQSRQ